MKKTGIEIKQTEQSGQAIRYALFLMSKQKDVSKMKFTNRQKERMQEKVIEGIFAEKISDLEWIVEHFVADMDERTLKEHYKDLQNYEKQKKSLIG